MTHAITESCWRAHCFWHDADEDDAGCYRACFECRHVYRTAQDLVAAYNEGVREVNASPKRFPDQGPVPEIDDPGQASFCPYCMHDF